MGQEQKKMRDCDRGLAAESGPVRDADYYIRALSLEPHIEGGWFREILHGQEIPVDEGSPVDEEVSSSGQREPGRPIYSSIYFLLRQGEVSHLHRIDADELWALHDGGPLSIVILSPQGELTVRRLGLDIGAGQEPQILVPAGSWFGALMREPGFSLVGCVCVPSFSYGSFELMSREELRRVAPQLEAELLELLAEDQRQEGRKQ